MNQMNLKMIVMKKTKVKVMIQMKKSQMMNKVIMKKMMMIQNPRVINIINNNITKLFHLSHQLLIPINYYYNF